MTEHIFSEITLPDSGEVLRWSRDGPTKATVHYEARVLSFGSTTFNYSDQGGNVQSPAVLLKIRDEDRAFSRRVARKERLKGARAELKTFFGEQLRYSGEVYTFDPDGELGWTIALRPRDARLMGKVPSTRFTLQSFPNLDQETAQDAIAPWQWGVFDGGGVAGKAGALPTYLVDKLQFLYGLCVGWVPVFRVFVATTPQLPTAFKVLYETRDGVRYTLIKFPRSMGKRPVTVDAGGYSADFDQQPNQPGQPTLPFINSPGAILEHAAANLLLEDRSAKSWLATHADIDSAALATLDAEVTPLVPYKLSLRVAEEVSGYDVLAEVGKAASAWISWNAAGQLTAIRNFTPATADFVTSPWLREDHGQILNLERAFNPRDKVRRLTARYGVFPVDNKSGLTVAGDTGAPEGQSDVGSRFAPAFV